MEYDGKCWPPVFIFHMDKLHYKFLQHMEAQMDSFIIGQEHDHLLPVERIDRLHSTKFD